jgi:hypothetical protein
MFGMLDKSKKMLDNYQEMLIFLLMCQIFFIWESDKFGMLDKSKKMLDYFREMLDKL